MLTMFLASNICCVSSGTVNARYCWEPRDVSGAKPFMKKCNLGDTYNGVSRRRRRVRQITLKRSTDGGVRSCKNNTLEIVAFTKEHCR